MVSISARAQNFRMTIDNPSAAHSATSAPVTASADAHPDVDAALDELSRGERVWAHTPLARRAELLDRVRELAGEHAADWVAAAVQYKQLDPDSSLVGEEWISGPYAFAIGAAALADSVRLLAAGRSPLDGATFGTAGERTTVRALPRTTFDSLLMSGFSADVWLRPGIDRQTAIATAGLGQRDPSSTNGIGAILGAGNITSIAPLDVLYELYANNRVVALKLNPITDPLLQPLSAVLAPFIELGVLRILTGGAEAGGYLVEHDRVVHLHMTGSAQTHDAIVWGRGEEAARRKAAGEPRLDKPFSSELGGVSPTIVLPGKWSKADLAFQAEHIATQRLHNGGYNCVAAQGVIISADWPQREEFLAALRRAYERAPARTQYYPGSGDRMAVARSTYPVSERFGERLLVTGLRPERTERALQTEYFAPVLGVLELPGTGAEFARAATRVANDEFAGTLGVNIVGSPKTLDELGPDLDAMIEQLRYGTIAINAWTGVGFFTAGATWGAFPGHTIEDVQSGIGVVHNAFLLADTERTVVRGPFRPAPRSLLHGEWSLSPKPPWFVTNKTAASTGRLLAGFAGDPGWGKLPAIFASALRG